MRSPPSAGRNPGTRPEPGELPGNPSSGPPISIAPPLPENSAKKKTGNRRPPPLLLVGARGFEPPTPCSQSRCATRLRYAPRKADRVAYPFPFGRPPARCGARKGASPATHGRGRKILFAPQRARGRLRRRSLRERPGLFEDRDIQKICRRRSFILQGRPAHGKKTASEGLKGPQPPGSPPPAAGKNRPAPPIFLSSPPRPPDMPLPPSRAAAPRKGGFHCAGALPFRGAGASPVYDGKKP